MKEKEDYYTIVDNTIEFKVVVNNIELLPEEYQSKIKAIYGAAESGKLSKDDFIFKLIDTMKSSGKISNIQRSYIDKVYNNLI